MDLFRRLTAEGAGTALLLAAVVGSGIMAERLAGGNAALALLANAIATGATLVALILALGPTSGGHFNPVVTLTEALQGTAGWRHVPGYLGAQFAGAIAGVLAAHAMFGEPLLQVSSHDRSGSAQLLSEFVATFGLLTIIWGCAKRRAEAVAVAVGLYIVGAYWFTASTSFANPAVTAARVLTDTFAGIRPVDAPGFVAAQLAGALAAAVWLPWLSAAAPAGGADAAPTGKPPGTGRHRERVLILCTGNSARSQMAEGLLRSFGRDRYEVFSAGTKPSTVRPEAVTVMSEFGIDLSKHRSKHVDEFEGQSFDYVITVCDSAKESCPVFPGRVVRLHWSFPDPAAVVGAELDRLEAFRSVRDALATTLLAFVAARA
jgi:thioredoxin type arsenate reductase